MNVKSEELSWVEDPKNRVISMRLVILV
jgi:hypothetical protein